MVRHVGGDGITDIVPHTPGWFCSLLFERRMPPNVKLSDIYKGVIPFIILQLIALLVLVFWPQMVLWLPAAAYS